MEAQFEPVPGSEASDAPGNAGALSDTSQFPLRHLKSAGQASAKQVSGDPPRTTVNSVPSRPTLQKTLSGQGFPPFVVQDGS
jgi:hypothetical protein